MTPASVLLAAKIKIIMAKQSYPFKEPRIAIPPDESLDKVWYVEYYVWDYSAEKLKRKRVVLSQPTKKLRLKEGREIAEEILKILKDGAYINGPKSKTIIRDQNLTEALDAYMVQIQEIVKPSTWRTRRTYVRALKKFLIKRGLDKIKVQSFYHDQALEFADYLKKETDVTNRYRNNVVRELVTVFNYFRKRKIISENPFIDIDILPESSKKHTALRPDQITKFKNAASPQIWLAVQFIYYCAIRPRTELRLLKVKDIQDKTIRIDRKNAKSNRDDFIRIPDPLKAQLEKHEIRKYDPEDYVFSQSGVPGRKAFHLNQLYKYHRKILEEIGEFGNGIDVYSWKHTGAIALWQATQNIQLLREHLRHTDLATTIKYLRDLGQFTDYTEVNKFPEI
ncbi:tyrosine-type recombinase/integrase [Jiulongibacter sp. NS-SX5]|uniref:tyrosine-type recombinase/integrase n=1 Tax=Jiulongibacter sp. NS-SX5 TaxID=3463854 RepID=UPI0040588C87